MGRSGMVMKQIVLLFLFGLLLGCRTRSAVTPTPALPTEESNTAAPTPTLAAIQPTNTALPTATASPIAAVTATSTPTREEAQGLEERVSFDPGATSATIEQAVVRGTTNRYLVGAQAGQTYMWRSVRWRTTPCSMCLLQMATKWRAWRRKA